VVADDLAVDMFVVGEPAWPERGMKADDSDVRAPGEARD